MLLTPRRHLLAAYFVVRVQPGRGLGGGRGRGALACGAPPLGRYQQVVTDACSSPPSPTPPLCPLAPAAAAQWQQLKQRYWSPEGGAYHRAVWGALDGQTRGLRAQAPFLEKPLAFARRWWLAPPPMAAYRP